MSPAPEGRRLRSEAELGSSVSLQVASAWVSSTDHRTISLAQRNHMTWL